MRGHGYVFPILEGLGIFVPLLMVYGFGQPLSFLFVTVFTIMVMVIHQVIVHRKKLGLTKKITLKRIGAIAIVVLVVIASSSVVIGYAGQSALANLNASSPGLFFDNVWSIPDYVSTTWPYLVQYYHGAPLSVLGPTVPVNGTFQAFNSFGLDVGQFDNALAEILQHSGPLNSADQVHMETLASATLIPFIQQDAPAAMAYNYWINLFGSISTGSITIPGQGTYSNFASFLNEVELSTAFAQEVSWLDHWGWTQTCTSSASCANGQTVFVPAGRYWTAMTLGLDIEALSQYGNYTQSAVVAMLESLGYTPTLVNYALIQAYSFAGTEVSSPWGSNSVTTASFALIPDSNTYGSNPVTLSPGTPEPTYVVDQQGNVVYPNAETQFSPSGSVTSTTSFSSNNPGLAPPQPSDVTNWINSGCGQGGGCSFGGVANFWAAVEQNGGWGAVRGGYVPSLEVPTSIIQAAGQILTTPGFTLPTTSPAATQVVVPGNCAGAQCLGPGTTFTGQSALQAGLTAVGAFNAVINVIYHGYPVTVAVPGVNGVPVHSAYGTTCQTGCVSPGSWVNAVTMVGQVQQVAQAYHAVTGNYLYFGQPLLEQGGQPGLGAGGLAPSPSDALATALFNDPAGSSLYGMGALAAMDPSSPQGQALVQAAMPQLIAAGKCVDASSCAPYAESQYIGNLQTIAYLDPSNPDSITTYFGGGSSSAGLGPGTNTACGAGCGWTLGIPSFLIDPHCSDTICSNAANSVYGQNCSGSGCTTHYEISNYYQMFNDIFTNPAYASIKTLMVNAGITDPKKFVAAQQAIDEQLATGHLTQTDAAAVETIGDWIGSSLASTGASAGEVKAVFGLPFGGNPQNPNGYGYSSYNPQNPNGIQNFQQWFESCGVGSCAQISPGVTGQNVYNGLQSIVIGGGITLGQFLSQQGTYSGSAWSVVGPMILSAESYCGGQCTSLQQFQAGVNQYLASKGVNTAVADPPDKDPKGNVDPPSVNKSPIGGNSGNPAQSGPLNSKFTPCLALMLCVVNSAGNPLSNPANGISSGAQQNYAHAVSSATSSGAFNPNTYNRWALSPVTLSLDGNAQPGFTLLGSFSMSWFQASIFLILFLSLFLSILVILAKFLAKRRK